MRNLGFGGVNCVDFNGKPDASKPVGLYFCHKQMGTQVSELIYHL